MVGSSGTESQQSDREQIWRLVDDLELPENVIDALFSKEGMDYVLNSTAQELGSWLGIGRITAWRVQAQLANFVRGGGGVGGSDHEQETPAPGIRMRKL